MAAMFPSASITGAPKARTMEIIAALEDRPRGIYTGTIGYVAPNGDATFNVAIRTALVDTARESLTFGVGSGVVWDSKGEAEYDECLLKGGVLTAAPPDFELLETLAWAPDGGYARLDRHSETPRAVRQLLRHRVSRQPPRTRRSIARSRARRHLSACGCSSRRAAPPGPRAHRLCPPLSPARVRLAQTPIDSADRFLFHKTTRRAVYDSRLEPDVDDVLLWNERGELTESTIANIVVELDGALVTPPVEAGLLAGIVPRRAPGRRPRRRAHGVGGRPRARDWPVAGQLGARAGAARWSSSARLDRPDRPDERRGNDGIASRVRMDVRSSRRRRANPGPGQFEEGVQRNVESRHVREVGDLVRPCHVGHPIARVAAQVLDEGVQRDRIGQRELGERLTLGCPAAGQRPRGRGRSSSSRRSARADPRPRAAPTECKADCG